MSSLNEVNLIGNLGDNPGSGTTKSNAAFAYASLATNMRWKDKDGQQKEAAEWHKLIFFNKLAETVIKHLKKGDKIYIKGRLQTRVWLSNDGQENYSTEIICSKMLFLESKNKQSIEQVGVEVEDTAGAAEAYFDSEDQLPF